MIFTRLGRFVSHYWLTILLVWIVVTIALQLAAPSWDAITNDGDFAYLPDDVPTLRGERILEKAFPAKRPKSQIAVIAARQDRKLNRDDEFVAIALGRRFLNLLGAKKLTQARLLLEETEQNVSQNSEARSLLESARDSLQQAIIVDDELIDYRKQLSLQRLAAGESVPPTTPALFEARHNLALVHELLGEEDEAERYRAEALALNPDSPPPRDQTAPANASVWPLMDVWTWRDPVIGSRLKSADGKAVLIVLHFTTEFTATGNIELVDRVNEVVDTARNQAALHTEPGLQLEFSGSAAVGGDMFRGFRDSLAHTEIFTVALVFIILACVYRSPLLVAVPLLTIAVSWFASTAIVALLSQAHLLPGMGWWKLQIFTTSRIFIVVILFGAGTDFCLFLISRYREELSKAVGSSEATVKAIDGVGEALTASALTTIVGLAMMFFADFGKFKYSGPVIGICLTVTLVACLTFAPALLRAFGKHVFWPIGLPKTSDENESSGWLDWVWEMVASAITKRPAALLIVAVVVMSPFAWWGFRTGGSVTYDFGASLAPQQPSRVGAAVMKQHFDIGETGPVVLIIEKEGGQFDSPQGAKAIKTLADELRIKGVKAIRNVADPLGENEPGFNASQWERMAVRASSLVKGYFVSSEPPHAGDVARVEFVLDADPFSDQAASLYHQIDSKTNEIFSRPESPFYGAGTAWSGVTPAIDDLRTVTRADTFRIQILVVIAVFLVLLVIIRRTVLCVYLILSVLFSFLVTLGATELFFMWMYGDTWQGLDWKLPLFLFVILVAIGQDYNVYLVTRVIEEQKRHGAIGGLKRAVVRTGGIITSCGVIMAGTFLSMTGAAWLSVIPSWVPILGAYGADVVVLRGIVELGFALSLGVMLDTFVVRPILVPAFIAVWERTLRRFARK